MTDTTFYVIAIVIVLAIAMIDSGPSYYMLEATGQLEELSR